MGMAASQARLLTLTARLADNELRSQTINNAKMRLAALSAQASDEYVRALNDAQLMFRNTDMNGITQNQALNFNVLSAYSPYNTQYGVVNSAGLLLVSEADAKNFEEAGGDLDKFLKKYGIGWETNYFGADVSDLNSKSISEDLKSVYSDYAGLFDGLTNGQLKELYEAYNVNNFSIENAKYKEVTNAYGSELNLLSSKYQNEWYNKMFNSSPEEVAQSWVNNAHVECPDTWSAEQKTDKDISLNGATDTITTPITEYTRAKRTAFAELYHWTQNGVDRDSCVTQEGLHSLAIMRNSLKDYSINQKKYTGYLKNGYNVGFSTKEGVKVTTTQTTKETEITTIQSTTETADVYIGKDNDNNDVTVYAVGEDYYIYDDQTEKYVPTTDIDNLEPQKMGVTENIIIPVYKMLPDESGYALDSDGNRIQQTDEDGTKLYQNVSSNVYTAAGNVEVYEVGDDYYIYNKSTKGYELTTDYSPEDLTKKTENTTENISIEKEVTKTTTETIDITTTTPTTDVTFNIGSLIFELDENDFDLVPHEYEEPVYKTDEETGNLTVENVQRKEYIATLKEGTTLADVKIKSVKSLSDDNYYLENDGTSHQIKSGNTIEFNGSELLSEYLNTFYYTDNNNNYYAYFIGNISDDCYKVSDNKNSSNNWICGTMNLIENTTSTNAYIKFFTDYVSQFKEQKNFNQEAYLGLIAGEKVSSEVEDLKKQFVSFIFNDPNQLIANYGSDKEGYTPMNYVWAGEEILDLTKFFEKKDTYLTKDDQGEPVTNYGMSFLEIYKKHENAFTQEFRNVVNAKLISMMIEELGEPKYTWNDSKDLTSAGNADVKAQWYTNLFNRMLKGYKTLEDGLASSKDWLEHAFETGLVSMEQVDLSYNWKGIDYKNCASITEETDNSAAVARAEANYKRAMNDIQQKDSIFDLQLRNLDTEHTAVQTEYDIVKKVMDKNIERTMKFNQSA